MTLKTEEEARGCWCPFARTMQVERVVVREGDDPTPVAVATNREPDDFDDFGNETVLIFGRNRCIASDCMAWRWGESVEEYVDMPAAVVHATRPRKNRKGYCGLAGQVSS